MCLGANLDKDKQTGFILLYNITYNVYCEVYRKKRKSIIIIQSLSIKTKKTRFYVAATSIFSNVLIISYMQQKYRSIR